VKPTLAKQNLAERDFSALAHRIPGINDMLNSVPQTRAKPRVPGGLGSVIAGESIILPGLASLTEGFSELGLNGAIAYKFVELVLKYVQSRGGVHVRNLLEKALL
jgi:hypothetical protein